MGVFLNSKNARVFGVFILFYSAILLLLASSSDQAFEHLHMALDTGNGILSLLLAMFLWGNWQTSHQRIRQYLAVCFAFAAATELLHALVGVEWSGWMEWVESYSHVLRPATWPPSTYVLPIALAWILHLLRRQSDIGTRNFVLGMGAVSLLLYGVSLTLPPYVDTGILGIHRPTQLPLLFLWAWVIYSYWHARERSPLFEGLVLMGIFLFLSDLFMLYSTAPHERFAMMAHAGKLTAYTALHFILMRIAATDAAARDLAEAELFTEKNRLQVTLDSIGDAVITTDTEGRVTYLNPIAENLTGWSNGEAQGKPLTEVFVIINEQTRLSVDNPVALVLREKRIVGLANHTVLIRRNGDEFCIEDSAAPIYSPDGVIGVVLVFHDVSFARRAAEELSHQARHDALTGLINRSEFEANVTSALTKPGKYHTVLFLDLDQFKVVNDTCGHIAGDELLRQIASRMHGLLRDTDTLARLGGDEFGVLLQNCPLKQGRQIAEKLLQLIGEFRFTWEERTFSIGASIGLVNFNDTGYTYGDVMKAADTACYIAKDMGRNRIHVFGENDSDTVSRRGEMDWVGRIHHALEHSRFCLFRQKIVRIGKVGDTEYHYEILIRMLDEQGNLVPPMAFIPAAERYNLMPAIDRWVVHAVLSRLAYEASIGGEGSKGHIWAINLSGASLNDEQFLKFLLEQFSIFKVPPQHICFEITETAAITNLTKVEHFISRMRKLGCRFSLDDFGSGMSSFGYLKYLPVDYLKIDGSFVKDMVSDPIDCAMVEAINKVGHLMGLKTIAEYVENDEILGLLGDIGVDYAQGYGIHKPEPF